MHVLHTVASLHPNTGGPARSVPGLAGALASAGIDVSLWSPEIPADFVAPPGVNVCSGDLNTVQRPNLIHDHGLWLPFNHRVAKWARAQGIQRIVSPRGMLEPWALNHRKWKKKLAWWLYQGCDLKSALALHATAPSEADQFRALGLKAPIFIAANGVDLPEIPRQSSDQKTVLFMSRVHPKKGLPMWVEAWKEAAPADWYMRVIGPDEGGHTEEIRALTESAGIANQWSFEGPLEGDEKLDALASADLFVLPTFSENFGIVVAEALALGTPVITTTGTPWEGLHTHQCGWWVDPEVSSLTKALRDAIASNKRTEMGQRGQAWVREEFAWDSIGERVANAYREHHHGH